MEKTIPQMENEILDFWKEHKTFEKSVEKNKGHESYVFYDGPPFISGLPHYGQLLGSIAKDVIPRYWTMRGKYVERLWGWDAHGLAVETRVQDKLGIKNRRDIETYGLEKFIKACYEYTSEISAQWGWYVDHIGRWVDMEHAYRTTDQNYMESVMWAFKQLYDKDLIYEGIRTSLFCTTCGTPVSNFEIAMDNSYKDVEDPAITVKFPVTTEGKFKGVNVLAWTTTPWTMPSNRALVVDEKGTYVLVESNGEQFVAGKAQVNDVFKDKQFTIKEEFLGQELIGLSYEPPYRFYTAQPGEFQIYQFEGMVTAEEGTGIVHSAPGFGEIDTKMGRHYNLTIMMTIDDEGKFLPGSAGTNPWTGVYYSKANDSIREDLTKRGLLFRDERIVHRFPFHDRCNTLLIQKAQNSWFVNVEKLKPQLLKNNETINWIPEHLKYGRFAQGIEQAPDWCISRSRFWATPMPVWQAEDGDRIVVSSVKELEELSGQKVENLHRPYIDQITITKNGRTYKRVPEVLDSWMEAGSMPYAQLHYPFENQKRFEENYPGDYIVEYIAQVRAWFFVMHVLATALFDSASFKNVISTGVMAGSDGRKMSKTYKNFIDPRDVLEAYGGDAMRLYFMGSPLMLGENANFDEPEIKNKSKNVLNPLWNSVKFFKIYADLHKFVPGPAAEPTHILDKWIMARLNELVKAVDVNLQNYLTPPAVRALEEFVDDLSRWYVRRSRDRMAAGDLEALNTYYTVLNTFAQACAPLVPFITESIYQAINSNPTVESVHLLDFPAYNEKMITESSELLQKMANIRDLVTLLLSLRTETGISVRQPLSLVEVVGENTYSDELLSLVRDEVNVKEVKFVPNLSTGETWKPGELKGITAALNTEITHDLKLEGAARELVRKIQDLRKAQNLSVSDTIELIYPSDEVTVEVFTKHGEDIKKKVYAAQATAGEALEIRKI